jgi:hypothetical protein
VTARLLVGTTDGLSSGRIPLSGGDFTVEGAGGPEITALGNGGWVLAGGQTLSREGEDGRTAEVRVEGPPGRCLLAEDDEVLVGTAEARLLHLEEGALRPVEAFDRAPGRDEWYTPWGGPPDVRSLSRAPDGTLYANVHVGGILRRDEDGTFTPTIDIDADVHQVLAHQDAVLAATARGLAESRDRGATWRFHTEGLHATYCRAVAVAGDHVLVSASTGPSGRRAAVYRRPFNSGAGFERCADGLPEWFDQNVDTHCLAAHGEAVAIGTGGGEVFLSLNEGRTWDRRARSLPPVTSLRWEP